jgi:Recombination endonuclease VII
MPRKDREAKNAYMRAWNRKPENKARRKAYQKKWDDAHREHLLEYRNAWMKARYAKDKASGAAIRYSLQRHHVTVAWFEQKLLEQGNVCAICRLAAPKGERLHVDHDHSCCATKRGRSCGKCVRGLLCSSCNPALDRVERDPEWGTKALAYLSSYALQ